jgi:enoyl-CoA hydratase/carnithine racemase
MARTGTATVEAAAEPVLRREDRDGIARLTLDRPQARNALSIGLMTALEAELSAPTRDARPTRPFSRSAAG